MEVVFSSRRLRDTCASEKEMVRRFRAVRARKVALRLQHLRVSALPRRWTTSEP
jgi:hypothetical protein